MSKTIMIVEDEKHFHELYKSMLEDTDYRVIHSYDGDEAMSKLEEDKPDLIILDMLLNLVSGEMLFKYMNNLPEYAKIPVIIASSAPKSKFKDLLESYPNLAFLEKTFTREELIEEIDSRIGQRV